MRRRGAHRVARAARCSRRPRPRRTRRCGRTPRFEQELQDGAAARSGSTSTRTCSSRSVEVLDQHGQELRRCGVRTSGPTSSRRCGRSRRGAYTVRWHAISADSHVVSGVWTFGVGVPAPPPTEAYGAGGPTITEHVVRWLWFLALALTIGSLGFRLICLRGLDVPLALERQLASPRASVSSACSRSGSPRSRSARGRAAAVVRQVPLRRPLADDDALRGGVHRHDARLRASSWR